MVFFVLHPSGLILNASALMPHRASSRCSSSEMHAHLVELGVRTYSPDEHTKKPQLMIWGLVLLVKCGASVGIIRGYAAHPVGVAVALLWRCLALGARLELGVRTYSPDDANKKPQLKSWGLIFGAPGGIRTPDQVVRSHLLYPAELRVLEVF